jgi:uncharacterized protein (TIGR00730 family)
MKRICVFCASSSKVDKTYFDAAEKLAAQLVSHDVTIVYGGGAAGLMGCIADTALEHGGHVVGIIPKFMTDVEWQHKELEEIHVVADMHERKRLLLEGTDALIALPGGSGTLEELMEAISLKRLGLYTKPIIILNVNGYYDPLIEMLERSIHEKFMSETHRKMWTVVSDPDEVMSAIEKSPEWSADAISFAAVK